MPRHSQSISRRFLPFFRLFHRRGRGFLREKRQVLITSQSTLEILKLFIHKAPIPGVTEPPNPRKAKHLPDFCAEPLFLLTR
jgi:hypothetical protein